jgi:hypothetical protein
MFVLELNAVFAARLDHGLPIELHESVIALEDDASVTEPHGIIDQSRNASATLDDLLASRGLSIVNDDIESQPTDNVEDLVTPGVLLGNHVKTVLPGQ